MCTPLYSPQEIILKSKAIKNSFKAKILVHSKELQALLLEHANVYSERLQSARLYKLIRCKQSLLDVRIAIRSVHSLEKPWNHRQFYQIIPLTLWPRNGNLSLFVGVLNRGQNKSEFSISIHSTYEITMCQRLP